MHIWCICSSNIIYNYVHMGTDTSVYVSVYECVMHLYVCSVHSPSLVDPSLVNPRDKCEMLGWKCSLLRLWRAGGCELATGLGLGEVEWQCCRKLVTSQLRRGRHKARCAPPPQCSVRTVRCGVTFRTMESVTINCKSQCCGCWPEWTPLRSSLHQSWVSTLACEAPCCLAPTGLAGHELPQPHGALGKESVSGSEQGSGSCRTFSSIPHHWLPRAHTIWPPSSIVFLSLLCSDQQG